MSSMFSHAIPPAPTPQPPAPMPDPESPAALEAKRRSQMDVMARAGRTSTILTAPENRGSTYSAAKLGSAA